MFVFRQMPFDLNGLFKSTTSQFCDFCRLPVTLEGPASHMSLGLDCWRRPSVTTTVTKHRTNVPFCQPSGLFYLFFFKSFSTCHDIGIFLHFRPMPCSDIHRKTCGSVILSQYWFANGQRVPLFIFERQKNYLFLHENQPFTTKWLNYQSGGTL